MSAPYEGQGRRKQTRSDLAKKYTCICGGVLNAKHEPSRGAWGHAPQENFEKLHTQICNFSAFYYEY